MVVSTSEQLPGGQRWLVVAVAPARVVSRFCLPGMVASSGMRGETKKENKKLETFKFAQVIQADSSKYWLRKEGVDV